jgi:hypothetical protein
MVNVKKLLIDEEAIRKAGTFLERGLVTREEHDRAIGTLEAWKPLLTSTTTAAELEEKYQYGDWQPWIDVKAVLQADDEFWNYSDDETIHVPMQGRIGWVLVRTDKVIAYHVIAFPARRTE